MAHAKLSPSSAERWMTCPGSVVLSDGMPEQTSKFAEEGTLAHSVAEAILREDLKFIDAEKEMLDNVNIYVDYVQGLKGKLHVEQRVKINEVVFGTADAVVLQEELKALHIVDLKYGAGVAVEIVNNLQLKIYALAALLTFKYPVETVTATIVQPRCPHSDGPIRSVTYDMVDLMEFHTDIEEAIVRVQNAAKSKDIIDYLNPSEKACRWCLAAPKCPLLAKKAQAMAKKVFTTTLPYNASSLAETLEFLPLWEAYIKNVREFAYAEAEKGIEIPNHKLVEKRATRKWRNEGEVAQALMPSLDYDVLYERKLISPAAAEKLLAKADRAKLEELTVKESSGHVLVHESDKRPAIKVDAKSAFSPT